MVLYEGVILLNVTLPNGKPPTWRDCVGLNIGVGVIPEIHAQITTADGFTDPEDAPFYDVIDIQLRFNLSESRYVACFVGVSGSDVSSASLREIRVGEAIRMVAAAGIFAKMDRDDPPASIRDWWGDGEYNIVGSQMGELVRRDGPVEWVLRQLSLVYNIALISSQPPAKAVEKGFGLPTRTAARWIAKARELGLLTRPSAPSYEFETALSDVIRDKMARGDNTGLIHEVTKDDLKKWGIPVIDMPHVSKSPDEGTKP